MKKFVGAVFLLCTVMTHQLVACDMGAIEAWIASICDDNGCAIEPTTRPPAPAKVGYGKCDLVGSRPSSRPPRDFCSGLCMKRT